METKRLGDPQQYEIEGSDRGTREQISNLQRLVCELLAKNQSLRIELMAKRAKSGHDKGSALFLD
jgi:hypothetical protein